MQIQITNKAIFICYQNPDKYAQNLMRPIIWMLKFLNWWAETSLGLDYIDKNVKTVLKKTQDEAMTESVDARDEGGL